MIMMMMMIIIIIIIIISAVNRCRSAVQYVHCIVLMMAVEFATPVQRHVLE